ncbi:MAG: hypothetical protein ACHQT7_02640 [Candidatus Levyibacteriota bacterium]
MDNTPLQPQEVSLGVYPPVTRIFTNPKAQVSSPINVSNHTNDMLQLDIVLRAFRASDANNGTIQYYSPKDTPAQDLAFLNTVQLQDNNGPIKQVTLYPNESKTLHIVFPGPLSNKDFYFSVIFLHQGTESKTDESLVHVATGVAGNVLVSEGNAQGNNVLLTPDFQTRNIVFTGPAKFNLTLNNNSDNFISTSGNVYIYDIFGNKAGVIPLKPAIILNNSSRIMTGTDVASGKGQDIAWGERFLFGYYRAQAVIKINQTGTQTYETHFFAVPVFILLIFSLILFVILSILHRTLKKLNFKES